jgi:23S rRNA (guanosine2251-2'-O)-methyltransferase
MNHSPDIDLVFGRWPVREALGVGPVKKIFLAKGIQGAGIDEIISEARERHIRCEWVDRSELDRWVGDANHQGVAAHVSPFQFCELDEIITAAKNSVSTGIRILFLDGIQDPQNLGSILRSAAFFGIPGVVIPKWRAASLTGTVIRASAGAARLLKITQVSNVVNSMEKAKKAGFWIVGADMEGQNVKTSDLPRPLCLVMGSEGEGIHELAKKKCDVLIQISSGTRGKGVGSLNVGVATGILLHQFA